MMITQRMNKKRSKQKKQGAKEKPQTNSLRPQPDPEPENPFDFGGLPNRNLKKNLACG
jgi:hypothetical protein